MRKVHGPKGSVRAGILAATFALIAFPAKAEDSSSNGFSLPGVTLPSGTDEVRAADGTSCRSAVGGNGAYVDMGMITSAKNSSENGSYYGRLVVPLSKGPKRLDCTKLYELEVERLKLELELAKAGLGRTEDSENAEATDSTETASVSDDTEVQQFEEAAVEEVVPTEPASKAKKKKKPVAEQAAVKPAKKKKVGNAGWADEGWSDVGLSEN